jgi:integrase
VHVRRRKGSRDNLTTWTPRLRAAIAEAKNLVLPAAVPIDPAIVRGQMGGRLTESGFQTTWQRLMTAAIEKGVIEERFTFHDLKAKGVSDSSGDKQAASGHKTAAMVKVYDRKLTQVKPAGGE